MFYVIQLTAHVIDSSDYVKHGDVREKTPNKNFQLIKQSQFKVYLRSCKKLSTLRNPHQQMYFTHHLWERLQFRGNRANYDRVIAKNSRASGS